MDNEIIKLYENNRKCICKSYQKWIFYLKADAEKGDKLAFEVASAYCNWFAFSRIKPSSTITEEELKLFCEFKLIFIEWLEKRKK